PLLRTSAPRAELHRVHHPAPAPGAAASVIPEALRGLERFQARPRIDDRAIAPGAVGEGVRHHPTAGVALRAGLACGGPPMEVPPAVGAEVPIPFHLRAARRAAEFWRGDLPLTLGHALASAPPARCAARTRRSPCRPSPPPSPSHARGR